VTEKEYVAAAALRTAELEKTRAALEAEQRKIEEESVPRLAPLQAAVRAISDAPVMPAVVIVEKTDYGRCFCGYLPGCRDSYALVAWFRVVTGGLARREKVDAAWTLSLTLPSRQRVDTVFVGGEFSAIKGDYPALRDRAIQAIRDAGYEVLEVQSETV
jgi:hypothetical protein